MNLGNLDSESHHANHHHHSAMIRPTKTVLQLDHHHGQRYINTRASLFSSIRRKLGAFRRRKLPTVRLGGGGGGGSKRRRWRGFLLKRVLKMRSLKLKLRRMMKKMKSYCGSLGNDLFGGRGTMDSFQEAVIFETAFAIPIMSLTFINSIPESTAGRRA